MCASFFLRSGTRFNVRDIFFLGVLAGFRGACVGRCIKTDARRAQLMRTGVQAPPEDVTSFPEEPATVAERKGVHNASSKVSLVVQRMLFPLLEGPMRTHVVLDTEANQVELDLLDQVGRDKPGLMDDQQGFVQHLLGLIERYRWRRGAYARVDQS
jgi:hypothetical protein